MSFDMSIFRESIPVLVNGLWTTLLLVVASLGIGMLIGALVCAGRLSGRGLLHRLCVIYISAFRGLPETVLIFWLYFCGPLIFNSKITAFQSAAIALAIIAAAYFAEIFRAGIEAIPRGQLEAARALGLSEPMILRDIIAPQALRLMVAPLLGYTTILIKNTSIASAIGVEELFYQANVFAGQNLRYFEVFTTAAIFYFVMIAPLSILVQHREKRTQQGLL
jgi:His/Glu/Gln/Arg/opine family amino acid ABC transporter permease subunit